MRTCLAILLVAAVAGSASAAWMDVMTEDFSTDPTPRGWIADSPAFHATGGVGDSGCYSGTRTNALPWVGMNANHMNIPATFNATLYNISIDVRWEGANKAGIAWEIYGGDGTSWKYDWVMEPPTVWTNYSVNGINADWSDADAATNGWTRTAGSGSFSGVWRDATYILFTQAGIGAYVGDVGTVTGYVDNFVMQADVVPEPATLGLLSVGVVGLVCRRKRMRG